MTTMWMARSSRGRFAEQLETLGIIAIGYGGHFSLANLRTRQEVGKAFDQEHPTGKKNRGSTVGQLHRFRNEMQSGDWVVTYDSTTREYLVGVMGEYEFRQGLIENLPHTRRVDWQHRVSRDLLSGSAKNRLNSLLTIFEIPDFVRDEILYATRGETTRPTPPQEDLEAEQDLTILRDEVIERAREYVKDMVMALDWEQMQDLVAGILRAMGYKTRVSPPGSDRGRDIVASPDGLGLDHPRIVVEVKHRQQQVSADLVRAFLGGLKSIDRGLYVSSGGFSKDAKYEADRSNPPITMLDIDDLVDLLIEHYDNVDKATTALVPLIPVYWPAR